MNRDSNLSTGEASQFALVFEGGGAKGVAYIGALRAIEERKLRISAVAGASAGAITATLVACGFTAERIQKETLDSLQDLASQMPPRAEPGFIAGVSRFQVLLRLLVRLRDTGAAFEANYLHQWLTRLLEETVPECKRSDGKGVTFDELFVETKVELFVVAANVSRKEQVVFSHHTTPQCQVVPAVLASSGLPGAFVSHKLIVREHRTTSPQRLHTVVDGGIWANYPQFVFKDHSFRASVGLPRSNYRVVGFVLEETHDSVFDTDFGQIAMEPKPSTDLYRTARFADPNSPQEYARTEAMLEGDRESARNSRPAIALSTVFLVTLVTGLIAPVISAAFRPPWVLIAIFSTTFLSFLVWQSIAPLTLEDKKGMDDSWPRNRLMRFIRIALKYLHPWVLVVGLAPLVVTLIFAIAADKGVGEVASLEERLFRLGNALFVLVMVFVVGFVSVIFATSVVLLALAKRVLADAGWGIAQTYAAGPGAPRWAGAAPGDWVVRVPVPREISTLSFDIQNSKVWDPNGSTQSRSLLEVLWRKVHDATGAQLDRILSAAMETESR